MAKPASLPFSTTLHVRDNCLCLHAQRAARALARRFDEALKPFRLTNGQFSLLMSLNRPVPPTMGPVADLLAMDRTTLTAMLKPLQRRGLVLISVGTDDRRGRTLALTDTGRALLIAAMPAWTSTHADLEQLIESADQLRADLRALSATRLSRPDAKQAA